MTEQLLPPIDDLNGHARQAAAPAPVIDLATTGVRPAPAGFADLARATADLEPPFAVLDVGALRANAADMVRRAGGKPIRLASKSVRCRTVIRAALALDGFRGILAFTLPEALWLAGEFDDIFVGYPTADRTALRRLAGDESAAARVTVMIDSTDHLDFIADAVGPGGHPIRVCLDLDASLQLLGGRLHVGTRRSPVREPEQIQALARAVLAREEFRLVGVMSYEGQIAGLGDNPPDSFLRGTRHPDAAAALGRRAARAPGRRGRRGAGADPAGVRQRRRHRQPRGHLGRGRGHRDRCRLGPVLAGPVRPVPGLPAPARPRSSRCPVVRRPAEDIVTVLGGGWIASGPVGKDRQPIPAWPTGLKLTATEGAGEVQTPLRRRRAPTACGSATGSGSGTPRPASSASGSTSCTWSTATGTSAASPPTAARATTSPDPIGNERHLLSGGRAGSGRA